MNKLTITVAALAFGAQAASASGLTYIVGTCTSGTQFETIQSALNANPAPSTVEVCPGQYAEQITITRPVTLEGIAAGNGAMAQIILPGSLPTVNASLEVGGETLPAVVQIYVNNVSGGSVNLSNLDVNGMGFSIRNATFVAVAYQQSSGTINHLVTSSQDNQAGTTQNVSGYGMWIGGGSSQPSVTVENSSFNAFTADGIFATSGTPTNSPLLTLTIENNIFNAVYEGQYNIAVNSGVDATISGNVINGGDPHEQGLVPQAGIVYNSSSGSITGNMILGSGTGIALIADGPSVTSNKIFGATEAGIYLIGVDTFTVSKVQNNTIKTLKYPGEIDSTGTAIELNCIPTSQVNSNLLMDAYYGYGDAPAGFSGSNNTYFSVVSEVATCSGSSSASSQASATARQKLLQQLPGHQGW
jgi:hypothetical protein